MGEIKFEFLHGFVFFLVLIFCLGKISFLYLNYYKKSFFVLELLEVLFLSLNFAKHYDLHGLEEC